MARSLEEQVRNLLKEAQIVAIICNQWGDSGKGKFTDLFAANVDVIGRGLGGPNAGHTVFNKGKENIFHLLPSGILYDSQGKINLLGNGVVIDLEVLCKEMDGLISQGGSCNNLMISQDAHIIMPYHIIADQKKDKSQKNGGIGSTGRGIGPCYADKIARRGVMIRDLFDRDKLARQVKKAVECYPDEEIKNLNVDDMLESLKSFAMRIKPFVRDTINEMHRFVRDGKKILLEGAQGLLLSVEYGTYPYVTSSDCSLSGTASGVGLSAQAVDLSFGIVKYPFMTRVGAGPFPTEFGGKASEDYCALGLEHDIFYEVKTCLGMGLDLDYIRDLQKQKNETELARLKSQVCSYINENREKIARLINSSDEFIRGIGVRLGGFEYGATTGRPRRTGWTDAVAAKYAVGINGPLFILTKPDSIAGCDDFSISYGYEHDSVRYTDFDRDCGFLRKVSPVLKKYEGYSDISEATRFDDLPSSLRVSMDDFEKFTGGQVVIVSNGPERDQTIIRGLH